MTHTSVPWMYFRNFRDNLCICKNPINISTNSRTNLSPSATNNDYEWVAELWAQSSTSPTAEANAAFIVRACNSHDELLEALEKLLAASKYMTEERCDYCHGHIRYKLQTNWGYTEEYPENHDDNCPIKIAHAIISKAKGESK